MNTIAKVPGLTKAQNPIQLVVLIAVSIITVFTLYMVPSWQTPGDPFLLAAVVGAVTVACLWLTRWLGSRAMKLERTMLAGFLVAMPLVYMMGWFAARDHAASSWIWVELLGLALFAAFAALGLKNSPWFLAIGIAGHGFAWDLWHYKNSAYIPDWSAVACILHKEAANTCLCNSISADTRSPTFASSSGHFSSMRSTLPSNIASLLLAVHCAKSRAVLMSGGGETHLQPKTGAELNVRAKTADTRR